jgi:ABC-2 type transport system permease protein
VTVWGSPRPAPSTASQWWVLTDRLMAAARRNGELITAAAGSVVITASFYIPLNKVLGPAATGASNYAQYVTPLIALQAVAFASIATAFHAATDSVQGINRRFRSMPIALLTPLAARISAALCRSVIGLAVALVCGYVIGFRFDRGAGYVAAFCLLLIVTGLALSFLTDVIGTNSGNPAATTQWLLLPQLIFGLLSVGIQPAERFPEWIQPIVRNQPVSQLVYALRALAGDTTPAAVPVTWSVLAPSFAWLAAMVLITVPLAMRAYLRRP